MQALRPGCGVARPTPARPVATRAPCTSRLRRAAATDTATDTVAPGGEEVDVVVVGAGIGGLSCAAMLAYYGLKVGRGWGA